MDAYYKNIEGFLQNYISEADFLIREKRYHLSFLLMSQIIEVMGAILDDKPLRAKEQSKKRFSLALKKLFSKHYALANDKDFLYIHYRCNMSHLLSTSNHILLTNIQENPHNHLATFNGKLVIIAEKLIQDIQGAFEKLLLKIRKEELKEKKGLFHNE